MPGEPTKDLSQGGQPSKPTGESEPKPGEGGTPPQPPETPPEAPPAPEFSSPQLRGRTVADVERLVSTLQDTVREQGQQLSQAHREAATRSAAPPPKEPAKEDFFTDPTTVMRNLMADQIRPLQEEVRSAVSEVNRRNAREDLRLKFKDWDMVEPYIDAHLARQNFPDPNNKGLLETLYFTVKGMAQHQGISFGEAGPAPSPTPGQPGGGRPAPAPPQHRASPPPPPPPPGSPGGGTPPARPLTESEKRLAREQKMSDEEYLYWQEGVEPHEVPTSTYGQEKK